MVTFEHYQTLCSQLSLLPSPWSYFASPIALAEITRTIYRFRKEDFQKLQTNILKLNIKVILASSFEPAFALVLFSYAKFFVRFFLYQIFNFQKKSAIFFHEFLWTTWKYKRGERIIVYLVGLLSKNIMRKSLSFLFTFSYTMSTKFGMTCSLQNMLDPVFLF